jgi:MFS superfamily sulfate permease-like transporter
MTNDPNPKSSDAPDEGRSTRSSEGPAHGKELDQLDKGYLPNLKYDLPASVVVFLVALPLCLGIAVASGAPPLAGLITGIIGGLVVAWISDSPSAVSGPAAGLTAIVLAAIADLGYEAFLLAVVLAGVMQLILGFARAGIFAYYFPSSVIKGMLAAIGIILIIKQIPHALGFDKDYEGDLTLFEDVTINLPDQGEVTLSFFDQLAYAFGHVGWGAVIITAVGLFILLLWGRIEFLKNLRWVPGPLVVVVLGAVINSLFYTVAPEWALRSEHLVRLPDEGLGDLLEALRFPDFARITDLEVYSAAFTIAAVASIETLLCIEAMDKLDPWKRSTSTNRELVAQGAGNVLAGMIGGLPMTAVIVRGSTNIQSGARTRMSAFVHGALLLLAVVLIPFVMNLIPLSALAAVLLYVGYKLANLGLFKQMLSKSPDVWVPFIVTIVAILAMDLLRGVGIGMVVGLFFILRSNLQTAFFVRRRDSHPDHDGRQFVRLELSENVSFLNRASVSKVLHELPEGAIVEIDGTRSQYMHPDVIELIHDFEQTAHTRGIDVTMIDIPAPQPIK